MDDEPGQEELAGLLHADALETHMSVLFFYGDRVVKVRKAVDYGFADFRDAEERRADCWREVQLNRRLSPDVYVGTAAVLVNGRTAEHAVVMRRLPAARNLAAMVGAGESVDAPLESVAQALARFHRDAERSAAISGSATSDALWQRWQATEEQLARFIGPTVDADDYRRLTVLARRYLRGRGPLLERRIAMGAVCDGHGDLQASDIFCMPDGPRLLDCLEFDEHLRHGDVLADAAFLVQDLERMGAAREARLFIDAYRASTDIEHPESLLHFYVAARAHVRLLVECLRLEQGLGALAHEPALVLEQALSHLERAIPRLVLVGGLPGTGKSTLSSWAGEELDATVLSSDHVRAADARGETRGERSPVPFATGAYTFERRLSVYERLLAQAAALLEAGRSVVLDATWTSAMFRARAAEVARSTSAELVELECRCTTATRTARLRGGGAPGRGESEATPEVAEALAAAADPWPSAHVVDTQGSLEETRKTVVELLRAGIPATSN